jgi:hypothetical protein
LEQFRYWGEDWRAKMSAGFFVSAICSKRSLDEVYATCGLTSPFGNIFTASILGAFDTNEWHKLVLQGFESSGKSCRRSDLELIEEIAGGLPFYTQMAAALLWQYDDHQKVREVFKFQAWSRFIELWNDLTEPERQTLRRTAVVNPSVIYAGSNNNLKLHGILRHDGSLFSSTFVEFVRAQP